MTRNEILAYNEGVGAALALALQCSKAIETKLGEKPTRFNFAIGALTALADEGRALFITVPPGPGEPDPVVRPHDPSPQLHDGAMAVAS